MNCELCKSELEAYLEGRLPEGIKDQVKSHLEICRECLSFYQINKLAEMVINEEKKLQANPFIASRVLANLEAMERNITIPAYQRMLRPVFITVAFAAAVLIGIVAGNAYEPSGLKNQFPEELTYIDDATIESVELLAND